jgi:valyl-tRNA synthetase
MARFLRYFDFLTRSQKTEIVEDLSGVGRGFKGVSQSWEVLLPFDSDENRLQELKRLQGEHEKLLRQIEQLEAKLANGDFVSRAPADVVQNFKKNLQDAIAKKDKLGKAIVDLS